MSSGRRSAAWAQLAISANGATLCGCGSEPRRAQQNTGTSQDVFTNLPGMMPRGGFFLLIAAQNRTQGCNEEGLWTWTSDLVIDLGGGSPLSPAMQLSPIIEVRARRRLCDDILFSVERRTPAQCAPSPPRLLPPAFLPPSLRLAPCDAFHGAACGGPPRMPCVG